MNGRGEIQPLPFDLLLVVVEPTSYKGRPQGSLDWAIVTCSFFILYVHERAAPNRRVHNLRQVWFPYVFILGCGHLESSVRVFTRSRLYRVRR